MNGINVLSLRSLDVRRQERLLAPPGSTIADIVRIALPGAITREARALRVTIEGHEIAPAVWHRVRPKMGKNVIVRVIPRGGSNRSVLATIVTIAAVAVGAFVGGAIAGALTSAGYLGFGAGSIGAGIVTGLSTAALATAGGLLFNALVPLQTPTNDAQNSSGSSSATTYSINGLQNSANPGGPVPDVLGQCRFAPPYAALPYTEVIDNEQYVVCLFNFGYGPLDITNLRLGETRIENFDYVESELRYGYQSDSAVTLYPTQVIEDSFEAAAVAQGATSAGGDLLDPEVVRTTARDCTSVSIDLVFPQGLTQYDSGGTPGSLSVALRIRQRPKGSTVWSVVSTPTVTAASRSPIRRSFKWTLPSRGQYEIGVTRTTANFTAQNQAGIVNWSALRSYRPEYPLAFNKPLAILALRMKATGQLQGIVSNLNADCGRICWDWDAGTSTWVFRKTSNPASLYRYALQGASNAFPRPDSEIDLPGLQEWHAYCVANGLTYNRVHDFAASLYDALRDIAAAGRATPRHDGVKWGVVVDRQRTLVKAHLSARNSWGFSGERQYLRKPDGFRVSFQDERQNFATVEQVIPWPGFVGDPQVTETLELPGVTNPAQVFRATRRRQYEVEQRLDTYTVNQDFEGLQVSRGDLAVLSHHVLDRGQIAARVLQVVDDFVILDTAVTLVAEATYACRFRLSDGTSLLKPVLNRQNVETKRLLLEHGDMPAVGDLALFGTVTNVATEAIVTQVEPIDGFKFRVTLVDHAPNLDTLVAADPLPDWAA